MIGPGAKRPPYFNQVINALKAQEPIYIGTTRMPESIDEKVREELICLLEEDTTLLAKPDKDPLAVFGWDLFVP
ncbi:hypothetical protein HOD83_00320 [Candidatus Woesearchaeota archaeon]|nr:hypothetical protein [Candidatus Woesearchaeota archaeon]MBT4114636.1 hypothetical protein [Candidatus Woesearchaeota archaeon]MBT4248022.1 hypothetical protein [Candidatus Woesearchaeota archaeon]